MDVEDRLIELSRKAAVIAAAASSPSRTSSPDVAAGIVDLAWELRDEIDAIAEKMPGLDLPTLTFLLSF